MRRLLRVGLAVVLTGPALVSAAPAASADTSVRPHSATFQGHFSMTPNDPNWSDGCHTAGLVPGICMVSFETPKDVRRHMCAKVGTHATFAYYSPLGDPSQNIKVSLSWAGGGALDGIEVWPGGAVVHMRIQIVDACGDAPAIAHDAVDLGDLGGLINLAPFYRFTGYVDVVEL